MSGVPITTPTVAPYGAWGSTIDAAAVAQGSVRLSAVSISDDDIYWIERRPHEEGRHVLVRRDKQGRIADVTPAGSNARTRVFEYGQGCYLVDDRVIYYIEDRDQRLYRLDGGLVPPVPLTPAGPWRYADLDRHPTAPLVIGIREQHTFGADEPVHTVVAIGTTTIGPVEILVAGHDFYACPRFSPDGSRLLWLGWRHPYMPWQATELWVADVVTLDTGLRLTNAQLVAGGNAESIFQPGWITDETIGYISDRTGWWNLYRADLRQHRFEGGRDPLVRMPFDCARPLWRLGDATWAKVDADHLLLSYVSRGQWLLTMVDLSSGELEHVPCGMSPAGSVAVANGAAVFVGQSATESDAVVRLSLTTGELEVLNGPASAPAIRAISQPEHITFPTSDDDVAHGFFYRPKNSSFEAPAGELPPLIVIGHGGPTGAATPTLDLSVQLWTSRGFAVVDVDYRGSSGYGRGYRAALDGRWGVADVDDCVSAARHLTAKGLVDGERLLIRGASAGGYTTFAAMAAYPGFFKAGAAYFGVADLEALAVDTHKFEARYLDSLIGPYPERRDLYIERSPIHHVDRLASPLILFQGLDDRIVPPNQTQMMADALRQKGVPVAVLMFEGEPHGFRRTETIQRSLEAELYFYGVVLGFTPAGNVEPVVIENVERLTANG